MSATAHAKVKPDANQAVNCRSTFLTGDVAGHSSQCSGKLLSESHHGLSGDPSLFVEGLFAGCDNAANEILSRSEIKWD